MTGCKQELSPSAPRTQATSSSSQGTGTEPNRPREPEPQTAVDLPHALEQAVSQRDWDRAKELEAIELLEAVVQHHPEASQYRRIVFRLVDAQGPRDAIGAIVQFSVGEQETHVRTLQRLAGHGYLCSNQGELVAGTGTRPTVQNVRVIWPDGEEQSLGELACDREYVIVRGQAAEQIRLYDE